jgi:uncharacterized protein (TIGR02145 family)
VVPLSPGTRGAVDEWSNTTIGIASHTGTDSDPYTDQMEAIIASNTSNTTFDTGFDYPADGGRIYLRGYYPAQELEADGLLDYDLGSGDVDLMTSQELSGTTASKITEVMQFKHLLTRVTFDMQLKQYATIHEKVTGLRIVSRDGNKSMQRASVDLSQTIDLNPASSTLEMNRNPRFYSGGEVIHTNSAGYTIPAYTSDRSNSIKVDIMFRPHVAFDIYVITDNNAVTKVTTTDANVLALCNSGGGAGNRYIVNLDFNVMITASMGDWDEVSLVGEVGKVPPPPANCYILNPSTAEDVSIKIPLSRINEYWGSQNAGKTGYGYGTGAGQSQTNALAVGDTWTASILWSDIADIAPTTESSAHTYLTRYTGTSGGDDFFTVTYPAAQYNGTAADLGNFVVIVKNTSGIILWSWHIWVTDYNPDVYTGAVTTYHTLATGGQLESYDNGTTVMMDRNLGQIEQYPAYPSGDGSTSRGILHYQWGRKDPFPTYTSLATATGSNTIDISTSSQQSIAWSVQSPLKYISLLSNWNTSPSVNFPNLWSDPDVTSPYSGSTKKKSLYDPCPPGWRVPETGVWNNLGDGSSSGVSLENSNSAWNDPKSPGLNYPKATPYSFYAATGYRYGLGSVYDVASSSFYWSANASASDTELSVSLGFESSGVGPQNNLFRTYGFSVRCSRGE